MGLAAAARAGRTARVSWPFRKPRPASPYGALYRGHNLPATLVAGTHRTLWVQAENTGTIAWRGGTKLAGRTDLAVFLDGVLHTGAPLPRDQVGPGERVVFSVDLRVPDAPGPHRIALDLVEQEVAYFSDRGVPRLEAPFDVVADAPRPSDLLARRSEECCDWLFRPAQRTTRGADGHSYPGFAASAEGCRLVDVDGRRYVDYVMGWGSAWLGYAHPEVQDALRRALSSGATPTLTHRTQIEVAERLCALTPGAQRALFGKNGSDACTAAVRLARAATGRPLVLVSGYHGWQDWYLESGGFADEAAVAPAPGRVAHFRFHDAAHLERMLEENRGRVAAVMLEPGAAIAGLNGPVHEADPGFLARVAELARREGALVVFDEIFTGLRYPGGSVQAASGVRADLTCLGKAIGGGLPLSAVVGTREAFAALPRIYYGPSYQGESYSFAAAGAVLKVAGSGDVAAGVAPRVSGSGNASTSCAGRTACRRR
jgi:glutamate-1-semialdehyde 2,1-aminomutase